MAINETRGRLHLSDFDEDIMDFLEKLLKFKVSDTEPLNVENGFVWFDTTKDTEVIKIRKDDKWVAMGAKYL